MYKRFQSRGENSNPESSFIHELDFKVNTREFEKKPVCEWNENENQDFFDFIKIADTIDDYEDTYDKVISNGKDFLNVISNSKNLNNLMKLFPMKTKENMHLLKVFIIIANHILKHGKFYLGFYRVLIKFYKEYENKSVEKISSIMSAAHDIEQYIHGNSDIEYLKSAYKSILQKYKKNSGVEKFHVKLVISDNFRGSNSMQKVRKIISPVVNRIKGLKQEYGIFHVALIVANLYIEWTNLGIVSMKNVESQNAIYCVDFDDIGKLGHISVDEISDIIANHVYEWNVSMNYSQLNGPRGGNCQKFVVDLCKRLDLSISSFCEDIFSSFQSGDNRLRFNPSKKLIKECSLSRVYVFKTHAEIDDLVVKIMSNLKKNGKKFEELFHRDYKVLKAYDRAMWLRYSKIMKIHEEKSLKLIIAKKRLFRSKNHLKKRKKEGNEDKKVLQMEEEMINTKKEELEKIEREVAELNLKIKYCAPKLYDSCPFKSPIQTQSFPRQRDNID